jgi:hypothetical protein
MLRPVLIASAFCFASALTPRAAIADTPTQQVCSTGSLVVCVNFALSGSSGNYALTVNYVSSNGGGVLSAFGIDGLGSYNFTATGVTSSPGTSFSFGSNCALQDPACALAATPAPQNGLTVGQSATLNFTASGFSGLFSSSAAADAHVISFDNPTYCSMKVSTSSTEYEAAGRSTAGGGTPSGSFNGGSLCATTTTPEPATAALLATGMMGLAGGLRIRRRR